MRSYSCAVIGATGMVGQRFVSLLEKHPWFKLKAVAASFRSAGKNYGEVMAERWLLDTPIPKEAAKLTLQDAFVHAKKIAEEVDFVFCAVDMPKEQIIQLEETYARLDCPVVSNNSAQRLLSDVPMLLPECNGDHCAVIESQRKRLCVKRGFVAVKPNCSLQSYVPALTPLMKYGLENVSVVTLQAISGAGKTFATWPEMIDNVIPLIPSEEVKSEIEPLKIWGKVENGNIISANSPKISAQCIRVPVSDGHMAAVSVKFHRKPTKEEIISAWNNFPALDLPSAPKQFLHYFEEADRPQTRLDRDLEDGMAVSIGRLREDSLAHWKFVCLSHNTLRGAAGGAVLAAELLARDGYFD